MKTFLKTVGDFIYLLLNFIVIVALYLIFMYLFKYLFWVSFVFVVIKYTWKKRWKDTLPIMNKTLYSSVYNFDRYCGYEFRSLFTFLFVKKTGTIFGNIEFSISEILGYNQRDKTLTWLGWLLVWILWAIDVKNWFKGGHCIASIKN